MLYFEILLKHEQPVRKGVCMWRVRNRVFLCGWDLVSRVHFQAGMCQIVNDFIYTFSALWVDCKMLSSLSSVNYPLKNS